MSRDATYPVSGGLPETGAVSAGLATEPPSVLGASDFLGYGILRPFRRDKKLDWAAAGGERLVRACVGQVLGTRAGSDYTQGEIPWRTEFGSLLYLLRHREIDETTQQLARVYSADALARWEPRIRLLSVEVVGENVEGLGEVAISVRVGFTMITGNAPGNSVLLPGLEVEVPLA
jgi:phage baseplate assembly protein W